MKTALKEIIVFHSVVNGAIDIVVFLIIITIIAEFTGIGPHLRNFLWKVVCVIALPVLVVKEIKRKRRKRRVTASGSS